MEQADILAVKLGHPDFKANHGWLDHFKKGIIFSSKQYVENCLPFTGTSGFMSEDSNVQNF